MNNGGYLLSHKVATTDCRLGLKCRLRSKSLSHRMISNIFSIYNLSISNKKNEIETVQWRKPKKLEC